MEQVVYLEHLLALPLLVDGVVGGEEGEGAPVELRRPAEVAHLRLVQGFPPGRDR